MVLVSSSIYLSIHSHLERPSSLGLLIALPLNAEGNCHPAHLTSHLQSTGWLPALTLGIFLLTPDRLSSSLSTCSHQWGLQLSLPWRRSRTPRLTAREQTMTKVIGMSFWALLTQMPGRLSHTPSLTFSLTLREASCLVAICPKKRQVNSSHEAIRWDHTPGPKWTATLWETGRSRHAAESTPGFLTHSHQEKNKCLLI